MVSVQQNRDEIIKRLDLLHEEPQEFLFKGTLTPSGYDQTLYQTL